MTAAQKLVKCSWLDRPAQYHHIFTTKASEALYIRSEIGSLSSNLGESMKIDLARTSV